MALNEKSLHQIFAFPDNISIFIHEKEGKFGFKIFVNKDQETEVCVKIKPTFPKRTIVVAHIKDILNTAITINKKIVGEDAIFFLDKQMVGWIVNKLSTQDQVETF